MRLYSIQYNGTSSIIVFTDVQSIRDLSRESEWTPSFLETKKELYRYMISNKKAYAAAAMHVRKLRKEKLVKV